ncbi:MAG: 50S ribosomal protein L22 [Bacillota bacterium]|jgi:large subunit ribosomal protein L22|nr:50S ribosomal protein L22 [Bacillota bacterium]
MEVKASAKHVRIAPRKVRVVVDLIRGKDIGEALAILRNTPKAASPLVEKVLKSAVANAEHNYDLNADNLYVAKAFVDQGPTLKRYRARARGMATRILKKTSHITLMLAEKQREG